MGWRRRAPAGAHRVDVIGLIQPAPDIDKGQRLDDPGRHRGMDEAIEMGAPGAAFFDQTMRAQQAEMLRNPRGWQGQRVRETADILFTAAQLRNQPQPIGMGKQLEQISQLARDDQLAGHVPGFALGPDDAWGPECALDLLGMAPPLTCKYMQMYQCEGMIIQGLSQTIPTSSAHDTGAARGAAVPRGADAGAEMGWRGVKGR